MFFIALAISFTTPYMIKAGRRRHVMYPAPWASVLPFRPGDDRDTYEETVRISGYGRPDSVFGANSMLTICQRATSTTHAPVPPSRHML